MGLQRPPQVIIEEDDDGPAPGEWTPGRGLTRGAVAALVVGAAIGVLWCMLAWHRPDVTVVYKHEEGSVPLMMGAAMALLTFLFSWWLFAAVHHFAQMVGGLCPVIVVVALLLLVIAKQITVASTAGVDTMDGVWVKGGAWLEPARFFSSNIGAWIGIAMGVIVFREGDSILDIFTRS